MCSWHLVQGENHIPDEDTAGGGRLQGDTSGRRGGGPLSERHKLGVARGARGLHCARVALSPLLGEREERGLAGVEETRGPRVSRQFGMAHRGGARGECHGFSLQGWHPRKGGGASRRRDRRRPDHRGRPEAKVARADLLSGLLRKGFSAGGGPGGGGWGRRVARPAPKGG